MNKSLTMQKFDDFNSLKKNLSNDFLASCLPQVQVEGGGPPLIGEKKIKNTIICDISSSKIRHL